MRFSIIIPFFNVEKFIRESIISLVSQDFPKEEFEVIAIDDCSPDGSAEIVKELMAEYKNIRLLRHNENKHLGGARNTGIKAAQGEWIFFVDSDDLWIRHDVLRYFDSLITHTKCLVLRSTEMTRFTGPVSDIKNHHEIDSNGIEIDSGDYFISSEFFYNVWTSCYNRNFIKENDLYFREHHVFEDSDWTIKVMWHCKELLLTDFNFYGYRYNSDSITSTPRISTFEDNILSVIEIYAILTSQPFSKKFQEGIYKQLKKSLLSFVRIFRLYPTCENIRVIANIPDALYQSVLKNGNTSPIEKMELGLLHKTPGLLSFIIHILTRIKRTCKSFLK